MNFEQDLIQEIESACSEYAQERATRAAVALAKALREARVPYSAENAIRALGALKDARYFDALLHLADAVFETGQHAAEIGVTYAQALIDTGRLAAAIPFLDRLLGRTAPRSFAYTEARGLVGRAYKQLYVNRGAEKPLRADYLVRALNAYYDVYRDNPHMVWHGINAAALLERGRADKMKVPAIEPLAAKLYELLQSAEDDVWNRATIAEAALARGWNEKDEVRAQWMAEARKRYEAFAAHPQVNAFALGSAVRQLVEVWRLTDDEPPGNEILPLLRSKLLDSHGGVVTIEPAEMRSESRQGYEKVFGTEGAETIDWYRRGLASCTPVCRVSTMYGKSHGTGFLVRGEDFHDSLAGRKLILTNEHVVSDRKASWMALRAERARFTFEGCEDAQVSCHRFEGDKVVWRSEQLDATLVSLTEVPPIEPVTLIARDKPPLTQKPDPETRVYVIGHPGGDTLSISLYDNALLDYDDTRLHYRAPTLEGNSGSPVFNKEWELVALHHSGKTEMERLHGSQEKPYEANEGIWIGAIRDAAKV